tara:strand:+ start:61 stop:306 length:246 start_codon:yes stop_codon:yes gene_type:complete
LGAVGDIPGLGVIMTNSVFPLEIGKKYIRFRSRNIRCWLATVGGNDIVFFGVVLEESGHVGAGSLFEGAENSDFILAPLGL